MHSSNVLAIVSTAIFTLVTAQTTTEPITGIRGNATTVTNNPVGQVYSAVLPEKEFFNPADPKGNVKGSITGTSNPNGVGIKFEVKFENLPTSGGPFLYHIHDAPVPADGNCTKTLAHHDPYIRGETPVCNASLPETCQVGDLSGKYGKITSDPFVASYSDAFESTLPGIGSFFGNRSFVIHFANKTRISCANFALAGYNGTSLPVTTVPYPTATGYPTQAPTPTSSSGPIQITNAANVNSGTVSMLSLTAVFGLFLML